MSGSLNRAIICGRLGGDPELRYTQSHTAVATFSVATTEHSKDRDGNAREQTEWHRIVAWSKLGENCAKFLAKGREVLVEGKLQTRSWDDKQSGTKKFTTEIVATNVQFLGSSGQSDGGGSRRSNDDEGDDYQPTSDDIPF